MTQQLNGKSKPPANRLLRKRSPSDFASRLFDEEPTAESLSFLTLTSNHQRIINEELLPLEVPEDSIKKLAWLKSSDTNATVEQFAENWFDADPKRIRRRASLKAILSGVKQVLHTEVAVRKNWADFRLNFKSLRFVPSEQELKLLDVKNIPSISLVVLYVFIFLFAMAAEFANVTYLVLNSGLGIENTLSAACFGAVYVLAPFVLFEFVTHNLNFRNKLRWSLLVKLVATPLVFAGLAVFAWKMGSLHDTFDAFADSQPWSPPLWVTLFVSMLLLAITVMTLPSLLHAPMAQLWPQTVEHSLPFEAASRRVVASNVVFCEYEGLRVKVEELLRAMTLEKREFVVRCLAAFHLFKAETEARVAAARVAAANES